MTAIRTRTTDRVERVAKATVWLALALAVLVWPALQLRWALMPPEQDGMSEAELVAFNAGREVAYEELAGAVAAAYQQGRADALAGRDEEGQTPWR